MNDQQEFQNLDDIRLLLQTVKSRKENFELAASLLERDNHFNRIKALWKNSLNEDGLGSELAGARCLIYKTLCNPRQEIKESVDEGVRKKEMAMADSGSTRVRDANSPLRFGKLDDRSRILRAKTLSCERCEKKNERQRFRNASARFPLKTVGKTSKTTRNSTADVGNDTNERSLALLKVDTMPKVMQHPPGRQHLSTKRYLRENVANKEETRPNKVVVCFGVRQKNGSKMSLVEKSADAPPGLKAVEGGNVGMKNIMHDGVKPDLKIQVLPAVDIKARNTPRPLDNIRLVTLTRDDAKNPNEKKMNISTDARPEALRARDESSEHGWTELMRNLPERVLAACKSERVARRVSPGLEIGCQTDLPEEALEALKLENVSSRLEIGCQTDFVEKLDGGIPAKDDHEPNEDEGERHDLVRRQILDSPREVLDRTLIATPPVTKFTTPPSPSLSSHSINQTELAHRSSSSVLSVHNSTSERALAPEPASMTSVSPPNPSIRSPELSKIENDPPAETLGYASPESPAPKPKRVRSVGFGAELESGGSTPVEQDHSLGQIATLHLRSLQNIDGAFPEHQIVGEKSSAASTPEDMTDATNATTVSTTFSEGEVKPLPSHGHRHRVDRFTTLLDRADRRTFHPPETSEALASSLGESGVQYLEWRRNERRPNDLRLNSSREDDRCSESGPSLGEIKITSSGFGQHERQVFPDTEDSSDRGVGGSTIDEWDVRSEGEIPRK